MKVYKNQWGQDGQENSPCAVLVDLRHLLGSEEFSDFFPGNVLVLIFSSKKEMIQNARESEYQVYRSVHEAEKKLEEQGFSLETA